MCVLEDNSKKKKNPQRGVRWQAFVSVCGRGGGEMAGADEGRDGRKQEEGKVALFSAFQLLFS